MSDDAPAFFNAWSAVFHVSETQKLLCSWHVMKNWFKKLSTYKDADFVKTAKPYLRTLIKERDEPKFKRSLLVFLDLVEQTWKRPGFADYFRTYYCSSEEKLAQWAAWARKDSPVNTNMFIESYHKVLKHKGLYLQSKQNHRLDYLLHILCLVAGDHMRKYVIRQHAVAPMNYRVGQLNDRHRNSEKFSEADITVITVNACWTVKSAKGCNIYKIM